MNEQPKEFANRDDPIPVLSFSGSEEEGNDRNKHNYGTSSSQRSPRTPIRYAGNLEVPKRGFTAGVATKRGDDGKEGPKASEGEGGKKSWRSWSGSTGSIQDQLYKLLLQSVIASEEIGSGSSWQSSQTGAKTERPAFSLPVMSTNFRRFNARIGVAFAFQNRLRKLFSWRRPTQTLSFLAMYSFICLDPSLVPVLPITLCLFFVTIPSYLVRHPAPPIQQHDLSNSSKSTKSSSSIPADTSTSSHRSSYFFNNFNDYTVDADSNYDSISNPSSQSQYHLPSRSPAQTPPTNPPATIRPTPETSRDFFRNMRDLQNSMEDFSRLHDTVIATVTPLTNFSDEARSSALFVVLALLAGILISARRVVPWRAILLVSGWALTGMGHPGVQRWLMGLAAAMSSSLSSSSSLPATKASKVDDSPPPFRSLATRLQKKAHAFLSRCIADDVILFDTSSETYKDGYDDDDDVYDDDVFGDETNHTNKSRVIPPEKYQVEIFELQKLQQQQPSQISSHSNQTNYTYDNNKNHNNNGDVASSRNTTYSSSSSFSSSIFSPSPYPATLKSLDTNTPTSKSKSNSKPRADSLSSILPPPGPFRWADDRWSLDTRKVKLKVKSDGADELSDGSSKGRRGGKRRKSRSMGGKGLVMAWVHDRGLLDVMDDEDEDVNEDEEVEEMGVGVEKEKEKEKEQDLQEEQDEGKEGEGWVVDVNLIDDSHDVDINTDNEDDTNNGNENGNNNRNGNDNDNERSKINTARNSNSNNNNNIIIWRRRRWVRSVVTALDGRHE